MHNDITISGGNRLNISTFQRGGVTSGLDTVPNLRGLIRGSKILRGWLDATLLVTSLSGILISCLGNFLLQKILIPKQSSRASVNQIPASQSPIKYEV